MLAAREDPFHRQGRRRHPDRFRVEVVEEFSADVAASLAVDESTPDEAERFLDDDGLLPQWQDDEEAMASVYGRDE